ncbi:MAG: 50S ribosomal protein L4 [Oligoflexia bacterium]|nr:50S ribosomal protein L4 [Oligoflexia bacterium]
MTELKLYNSKFEVVGSYQTKLDFKTEKINIPVVHQVIKSLLAGRRQGNAVNKCKAFVRGGGAKPFKQKGTGRARQGSSRSPLNPGGGSCFGPSKRSYEQKINKKMMLNAIHSVLIDKLHGNKLFIVDAFNFNNKTKELYKILADRKLDSSLVVTKNKTAPVLDAVKNLPRAKGMAAEGFSVYEAVKYDHLLIEKDALGILIDRLEKLY